ncbi:MAG TPA: methyltransferase [Cyanobacteria bacterium UBA8803]|nr:methyltransferase [Cyanobacteria bacterium UBA9273]HBL62931.1 methyltransferase [Cyanobacteria bacterium UBA8803]
MNSQPNNPNTTSEISLPQTLLQLICGKWVSQAIYVAAKLGIADLLKEGAKSSEELANSTGVDSQSLYRVLRALASMGIFAEGENRQFELTPLAEYLQTDRPSSLRAIAIMFGSEEWHWQPWGEILYSVKTGKPAFDQVMGMPVFEYLSQNPEAAKVFDQAMMGFTATFSAAIAQDYDFSSISHIVDVGGGQGGFLAGILKANPHLKGTLYDLPPVIEGAKQYLKTTELGERCQVAAGNFFESVPSNADAYILKSIIHDWDDERAIAILKNCHSAITEQGKLLLVEMVLPPGNEPFPGKFLDLEMLVMSTGGRERTEPEFRDLLAAAGFQLTNIIPTRSPLSVIEGVPISH